MSVNMLACGEPVAVVPVALHRSFRIPPVPGITAPAVGFMARYHSKSLSSSLERKLAACRENGSTLTREVARVMCSYVIDAFRVRARSSMSRRDTPGAWPNCAPTMRSYGRRWRTSVSHPTGATLHPTSGTLRACGAPAPYNFQTLGRLKRWRMGSSSRHEERSRSLPP